MTAPAHRLAQQAESATSRMPDDDLIERLVRERMAERFENEAFHWRFRLIAVETILMGLLVLTAGLVLRQPTPIVLRASVLVSASCLASGICLLELSKWTTRLIDRIKRRWRP